MTKPYNISCECQYIGGKRAEGRRGVRESIQPDRDDRECVATAQQKKGRKP